MTKTFERNGTHFRIAPITHKGQNRIREIGSTRVTVIRRVESRMFGQDGPWLFVSFDGADPKHTRWVHETADQDFVLDALD